MDFVSLILLLNNDRVMVSAGYDNKIVFYNLDSLSLLKSVKVNSHVFSIRWIPEFSCVSFGGVVKKTVDFIYLKKIQELLIKKTN